jgi:parallel beta-helix repeat protein
VHIVDYFSGTYIGGTTPAAGNVIADNGSEGIFLDGSNGTVIQGNSIIGNGDNGIYLQRAVNTVVGGTTSGARNTIASNSGGVVMYSVTGNSILGNSIHDNSGVGISLTGGANDNQAAPMLTSASSSSSGTTVGGTLTRV